MHNSWLCILWFSTENPEPLEGRFGSTDVQFHFDIHTNVGTLIVDQDRLGVSIALNGTLRAAWGSG